MTLNRMLIPVGALTVVLGAGDVYCSGGTGPRSSLGAVARSGRSGPGTCAPALTASAATARPRGAAIRRPRAARRGAGAARRPARPAWRSPGVARRSARTARTTTIACGDRIVTTADSTHRPRILRYPRRSPYRHYGPGPGLSVYFGIGSGYRYGSPYSGRVYGYSVPSRAYGVRRYYGDVRLEVRPREAAVYVDGYYAGIVDDFDGVFQRLTLEAGPHRIEIELPGFETRAFDVSVDPTRTVDVHEELFPERP